MGQDLSKLKPKFIDSSLSPQGERDQPVILRDPAKTVLIGNRQGEYAAYSTEETLARDLNRFNGWRCAAGLEHITVGKKGDIFLAACQAYGFHGNVFDGDILLPRDWIICSKRACMCGGDMQIRKAKSLEDKSLADNVDASRLSQVSSLSEMSYVAPFHYPDSKEQPCTISWDIGKRCNFACSYCPSEVSNRTDPPLSWDKFKFATDRLIYEFAKKRQVKWVMTGGEPTLIASYLDWVKYVRGFGHIVHTTTNGSRGPRYLEQLIEHSCIGLSVHLEYLNLDRLYESCQAIVRQKTQSEEAAKWWFGVRVMVAPNQYSLALEVKDRLLSIANFKDQAHFFMSPLHNYARAEDGIRFGDLMTYTAAELEGIQLHT